MFECSRKEIFEIFLENKKVNFVETKSIIFVDTDFLPVLDYIESKGLLVPVPSTVAGEDATFIYNKLQSSNLGKVAEKFSLFLYMRRERKEPVYIAYRNIFSI